MDHERELEESSNEWMQDNLAVTHNEDGTTPVSYTHLDVYKRQGERTRNSEIKESDLGNISKVFGTIWTKRLLSELEQGIASQRIKAYWQRKGKRKEL